ncbi:hypothetical protein GIB67_018090 [Kingdonia uniflora]|uniref:NAD-dependent epimerase/dehydratase domain-containing protein n=1 Tax=Kingdonia uniflora TaxID=39325 RepID=A0A7J7NWJ5_9MAGN|nr:hypothetical protein GIB67_018090 [Kingdonia uniflora]
MRSYSKLVFQREREEDTMSEKEKERVCVTGAGGFQATWVVKLLLSKGYIVHGTVRDTSDDKNAHLKSLENASENLKLFKADLLDYESLCAAFEGCTGVFHVASPVPFGTVTNPEVELIQPAVMGTLNVLRACSEAKIKRVVVVSSIVAMLFNPNWPEDQLMDESSWSDKEQCKKIENWYSLAKTEAESQAFEYAKRSGLDMVTVCPAIIFGPMLQPNVNATSLYIPEIMKGGIDPVTDASFPNVDVRDVAEALLLVYTKPETEGRYICLAHTTTRQELAVKLKSIYPNYKYPEKYTLADTKYTLTSEKLQKLGWKFRSLEETLVDSVECYQEKRVLDKM